MSSSAEDALCLQRIQSEKEFLGEDEEVVFETEKHYNYYGDRGVADLFTRTTHPSGAQTDRVFEFKSEDAVRDATGANEILRQFNRMCSYFYKDESITLPKATAWNQARITFVLCFDATPTTYKHVLDNHEIYQTITSPCVESGLRDAHSLVTFRSVETEVPVLAASSSESTNISRDVFKEMFERDLGHVLPEQGGVKQ